MEFQRFENVFGTIVQNLQGEVGNAPTRVKGRAPQRLIL